MNLAQMKAAITMEGVLSGAATLELIAEVEQLTEQIKAGMQPLANKMSEYAAENQRLTALCDGYRGEVETLANTINYLKQEDGREIQRLADALTCARAEGMEDKADAERWRAVIGCARVRALGCAGIINRREDGYAHIGVELWTRHEAGSEPMAIEWLTAFADIAVSLRATKGDSDEG